MAQVRRDFDPGKGEDMDGDISSMKMWASFEMYVEVDMPSDCTKTLFRMRWQIKEMGLETMTTERGRASCKPLPLLALLGWRLEVGGRNEE